MQQSFKNKLKSKTVWASLITGVLASAEVFGYTAPSAALIFLNAIGLYGLRDAIGNKNE